MKQQRSATLSEHLLKEADRFLMSQRVRRTSGNLRIQEGVDKAWRNLVQWRKTIEPPRSARLKRFAVRPDGPVTRVLDEHPDLVNEFYCRDLLKAIPGIVERTLSLSQVTLAGITSSELVYLREAANCYVFDLPRAAIALARAAMEGRLRKVLARTSGKEAVKKMELQGVIEELVRTRRLSSEARTRANRLRTAANGVLHDEENACTDALTSIEDARAAILETSRKSNG